jgi:predicted Zn-dependent protease
MGELAVNRGLGTLGLKSVCLLLLGVLAFSACQSSPRAFLSAESMEVERCWSLEQQLRSHQWGGWHQVAYDPAVAEVQELGMALEKKGQLRQALDAINLGLTQWPACSALLQSRAAIYGGMGYWRAAECDLEAATVTDPECADAWAALGRCRRELGLWNGARTARSEAERLVSSR